jgi:tRNA pseudouridine38-40 synthase
MKYLLKLSYLGTDFSGFQVQSGSDAVTVQGELCRAARELFCTECAVSGCSRTDAGVHAIEYFATLEHHSGTTIPPERLPRAMGAFLPRTIVVNEATPVPDDYSVRAHVCEKEYMYVILNTRVPSPFYVGRAWHVPHPLDYKKMNEAAAHFVGRHDFRAFIASGSDVIDTTRSVSVCRVEKDGENIKIYIKADGFLYNMVRIIAGTLVDVGRGATDVSEIPKIISSLDRSRAGRTAPPDGLYLLRVILK